MVGPTAIGGCGGNQFGSISDREHRLRGPPALPPLDVAELHFGLGLDQRPDQNHLMLAGLAALVPAATGGR